MAAWQEHITVRPITVAELPDVLWLTERLRPQDKLEIEATDTNMEKFAVDPDMENYIAYAKNGPVFMWGVSKYPVWEMGHLIWCVTRHDMYEKYKKEFVQMGHEILNEWKKKYDIMWNTVLDSNEQSKRWLKYMGAQLGEPRECQGRAWRIFMI